MNKSYDSIIGTVISGLIELREFVEEHESSKVGVVQSLQREIESLDYYMVYGEERATFPTIAGVDFTESLTLLEDI